MENLKVSIMTLEDLDEYYLGYRYYFNIITKEVDRVVAYM